MSNFPEGVLSIKKQILTNPEKPLNSLIEQLTEDTPEILAMWRSLESRKGGDDNLWILSFIEAVQYARKLPKYHYKSAKDRRKLIKSINNHCNQLISLLEENNLISHLVQVDEKMFNGFYIYEDLDISNQEDIDGEGLKKLYIPKLLENLAERCQEKIKKEPHAGKLGENSEAIRFIRTLADRNFMIYKTPLNSVLATAANAIYDTDYEESDIANLLNH